MTSLLCKVIQCDDLPCRVIQCDDLPCKVIQCDDKLTMYSHSMRWQAYHAESFNKTISLPCRVIQCDDSPCRIIQCDDLPCKVIQCDDKLTMKSHSMWWQAYHAESFNAMTSLPCRVIHWMTISCHSNTHRWENIFAEPHASLIPSYLAPVSLHKSDSPATQREERLW